MAQTAANLVDHVLPPQVPLRQWVLTVPFELRARLAYDAELLGGVSRELGSAVMDFYRRRFELGGVRGGKSGAVTVVQRSSSDLRLNPHYHLVALDGVFTEEESADAPTFHARPHSAHPAEPRLCAPWWCAFGVRLGAEGTAGPPTRKLEPIRSRANPRDSPTRSAQLPRLAGRHR